MQFFNSWLPHNRFHAFWVFLSRYIASTPFSNTLVPNGPQWSMIPDTRLLIDQTNGNTALIASIPPSLITMDKFPTNQPYSFEASRVWTDSKIPSRPVSPPPRLDEEAVLGIKRIGSFQVCFGGYSDVWMAEMNRNGTNTLVALKVLRPSVPRERLRKREGREYIWTSLHHENIALFYAVYHQPNGSPVFVSQWYENGTAPEFLRKNPVADPLKIIYDIASGTEYLHGKGVVHGDLKGSNVLIDDTGRARLIDFGLARVIGAEPGLETATTTTIRWCAPELLRADDALPTMSSDIYAFASTALELLTGVVPYSTINDRAVSWHVLNGIRPRSLTRGIRYSVPKPLEFWELLERCWAEPSSRPLIREVRVRLCSLRR